MANTTTIFLAFLGVIYLLFTISTLAGNIILTKFYASSSSTVCEGFDTTTDPNTTIPITTSGVVIHEYLCYDISDLSLNFARYSSIMFWFNYLFYALLLAFAISKYSNIQPILWTLQILVFIFILIGGVLFTYGIFNLDKKKCKINDTTDNIYCLDYTDIQNNFSKFGLIFLWIFFSANTILIPFIAYKYIR